ncbi:MAG: dihydrofolate reductase family protein [Melioribacteraceae bacterium]
MRKLKLQVQISVDGFAGGPNGELDWMTWNWDNQLKNYVTELTDSVDTILLGRKMTDGFISHWTNVMTDSKNPEYLAAKKFVETPKVVFTKKLDRSDWINTKLAKGDLTEEVNRLKKQNGKSIIVYGGASFVSSLIQNNLIDEYHLFINPTAIGKGMTIFNGLENNLNLKLIKSTPFDCGIVVNQFEPKLN